MDLQEEADLSLHAIEDLLNRPLGFMGKLGRTSRNFID
jgi:hypothetical protein